MALPGPVEENTTFTATEEPWTGSRTSGYYDTASEALRHESVGRGDGGSETGEQTEQSGQQWQPTTPT